MINFHKQLFILLVIILDRFSCGQQNDEDTTLGISEESSPLILFDSEDTTSEISPFSINYDNNTDFPSTTIEESTITENYIYSTTTETIVTETSTEYFTHIDSIIYGSAVTEISSEITENADTSGSSPSTTAEYGSTNIETVRTSHIQKLLKINKITTTEGPITEFPDPTSTSETTSPEPTHSTDPPYCEDKNIISVNSVINGTYSIYLKWSCVGEGCSNTHCKYTYNITYNDTTLSCVENSINITENIHSCTTYSGVITLIYDENPVSSASFVATTLPDVDPVQKLGLQRIEESPHILIKWNPSERSRNCVNGYLYEVFEDNILIWKSYQRTPWLYVLKVDGCKENLYEISAVYNRSVISNSDTVSYSNVTLNEAPIFVNKNITEDNKVFIWWKFGKFCKPQQFFVKCQLNNTSSFETKGTLNIKDDILTVQLSHLESFQNYSCQGRIENEIGNSSWSETVNFETFCSEPEIPEDLKAHQNPNHTSVSISWKPPKKWNGKEEGYKLILEFVRLTYYVSDRCLEKNSWNLTVSMNSSTTQYDFTEGYGLAEYKVSISAISSGGEGPASEDRFVTAEQVPDSPDNLEIREDIISLEKTYNVSFAIHWLLPCKINGNLSNYTLKVVGPSSYNFTKTIGDCLDCQYNFPVKPNSMYDIKVQANLKNLEGEIGEIYKVSSAGIPSVTSNYNLSATVNAQDIKNPESSIKLYIDENLFDKNMGQIIYYAIIVAEVDCEEVPKTGIYDKWPVIKGNNCSGCSDHAYEATMQRWNPFLKYKDSKRVEYSLGSNNSCNESNYCNHPLKANTLYYVKYRGFTENGFCDTALIKFQTSVLYEIQLALILGLVVGIIVIACFIAAALFYTKGKLNFKNWPKMGSAQQISPAPLPVTIKKFPSRFAKMIENPGKIRNEFQLLSTISSDVTLSTKHATLPINRKKNRYVNILPYDQTRVQLLDNLANSSDYINASYIKGYSGNNEYIATQGPTEATSPAFWQMVVEQNVRLIVMLTQFVENGKEKCYKYFPDKNDDYLSNGITIHGVEETFMDIYNQRTFRVVKGTRSKKITHVQFNIWPDFGVPNEIDHMIDFCNTVKEINRRKPGLILIHCSAGVGRTGTLIAVDILLQSIRDKKKVDIFGTVLNLRKQRTTMVQSERQYEFLYRCINHVISNTDIQPAKSHLDHITENQISESNML